MCESGTDGSEETEDSRDEDGATTTEEVVDWVIEPAAEEGRTNVRTGVDKTNDPRIVVSIGSTLVVGDTELDREGQVGTVGTGLVPSLDGSTN